MRDFRDAKSMAHTLRDALKAKSVETTHSECLELIAKAFGYENWNILSAKVEAARSDAPALSAAGTVARQPNDTLHCSFCRRSQHEVRKLIAGPTVFICDECVGLCNDIIENEDILHLFATIEVLGNQPQPAATEQLMSHVDRTKKHAERWRFTLQQIKRKLSMRDGEAPAAGDVLASPAFAYLKNKTRDDLLVLAQHHERALKRYEDAQRIATTVLRDRGG